MNTKAYFLNLFQYALIFSAATILFGLSDTPGEKFNLERGYLVASLMAVVYLGHKIAQDFSRESKK